MKLIKHRNYDDYLVLILGLLLAIGLRYQLLNFESVDFKVQLSLWYQFIVDHKGWESLKHNFYNYNPPYIYLFVIAYYLFPQASALIVIKSISLIFDFIGAFLVYKIVKVKYPHNSRPITALIVTLFAPTVVINSSFWGQCDFIYTTGLLACLYFLLKQQDRLACIAFGIALAFKMQAIFFVPLLLILALKKFISWHNFLFIPPIFALSLLPAYLAGRPLQDLLAIYPAQTNTFKHLVAQAPNLYYWVPFPYSPTLVLMGLGFTAIIVLLLTWKLYTTKFTVTPDIIIQLAMICVVMMPFILPKMHERYFFPADIISIIFAFYYPRYFFVPLVIITSSYLSYIPFFGNYHPDYEFYILYLPLKVFFKVLSIPMLLVLVFLIGNLFRTIRQQKKEPQDHLSPSVGVRQ